SGEAYFTEHHRMRIHGSVLESRGYGHGHSQIQCGFRYPDASGQIDIRITVRKFFRNLLSPPFIGFFAGLLFALFGWRLPEFCMRALHTVGQLTTPLSLIFIGISLADMRLTRECLSRDLLLASAGRLVISPLIMAAVVALCGVKGVMGTIFILQSALPAVMQAAILSANYKTDPEFGTLIVSLTTLLSILTVPLVMSLV
ncbi:MAG: AEC family transporter, partial [Desulfovibrio sp.]|nr:AEC family transporter [Desulfovibrio sp.]